MNNQSYLSISVRCAFGLILSLLAAHVASAAPASIQDGNEGMFSDSFAPSFEPQPGVTFGRSVVSLMVPGESQVTFTYTFAGTPIGDIAATSNTYEPADGYYSVTCFGPTGTCASGMMGPFGATARFDNTSATPELITSKFVGALSSQTASDLNPNFARDFRTAVLGFGGDPSKFEIPSTDFVTFEISAVPLPSALPLAVIAIFSLGAFSYFRFGKRS